MKLVFIDLDGTLIDNPSSEKSLLFYLIKYRLLRCRQWLSAFVFLFRWVHKYGIYVFIKDKAYLAGLNCEKVSKLAEKITRERIFCRLRPFMIDKIKAHAARGDINILLTGSHDFVVKVFANHLGITEISATKCAMANGIFLNAPVLRHPFRREKAIIAEEFCRKYNVQMEDTIAYGNSINDKFLLEAVGEAVAVTPDRGLRKLAQKENWQILE